MVHLNDIHPLTSFLRDHKAHIERLRETGRPEVLTVNGTARIVVQDAGAYQRLVQAVEEFELERMLYERAKAMESGTSGIPAKEVLERIRRRLNIDLP